MTRSALSSRPHDLPPPTVFSETIMHPAQFRDIWNGAGTSAERELAAAVLAAAIEDLDKYRYARTRHLQRLYWQAYQWIASEDRQWPFSFVNLCEFLQLQPGALREQLLDRAVASSSAQAA